MSQPPNVLDAYRTYSYHHILIAADSTSTAAALDKEREITKFDHPDVKFQPQQAEGGGQYVVLINGITDAQFSINTAKWASVLIPSSSVSTGSTITAVQTMAIDGEIHILEPQGVNFFNLLNEVTKSLRVDPALITFVLKTIFIGHRDDGTTSMITTIRPLLFMMIDITANIDVSGAEYVMALVGIANGAAKLPHCNSIATGFNFHVKSTLKESFRTFQEELNDKYDEKWNEMKTNTCGVEFDETKFSRVIYKFELDSKYDDYLAGTNQDEKFTDTTGKGGYVSTFGDGASIENLISAIMFSSLQVAKDAKGKLPDKRFMFKISSEIETDARKGTFTVKYHIHRYKAVVVDVEDFLTFEPPEGLGITYDYIFTGKNIDIKTFDLKMQYGLMFFQMLSAEGTSPTNSSQLLNYYNPDINVKGKGEQEGVGDGKQEGVKRPLFLGTTLNHPMFRDTKSIGASTSFSNMLVRHAAVENLGAKMTIRGNPQLMAETTPLPEELSPLVNKIPEIIVPESGTAPDLEEQLRNIMPESHKQPAYVKVKVWSPKSWTGSAAKSAADNAASYEGDYAENLWYDGWYYVLQINHVFSGGEFEQELEMISLPTEAADTSDLDECLDGKPTSQTKAEQNKQSKAKGEANPPTAQSPIEKNANKEKIATTDKTIKEAEAKRGTSVDVAAAGAKSKFSSGGGF